MFEKLLKGGVPVLVLTLALGWFWKNFDVEKPKVKKFNVNPIARSVFEKYYETVSRYEALNFLTNKYVSSVDILAMICAESGGEIYRGLKNSEIIGDGVGSFGVMQVSKEALEDVNRSLGTKFTNSDLLYSDDVNILVGSHYFQMCIEEAIEEGSENPKLVAVVKYNAGIKNATDEKIKNGNSYLKKWLMYRSEILKWMRISSFLP